MKHKKTPYLVCLLLFLGITLLECILIEAFTWAGFNGFGDPPMVYTRQGALATDFLILFPGIALIIFYLIKLRLSKFPASTYWKYIFTALCGIIAGVFLFLSDAYTGRILQPLVKLIIRLLTHSAWMEYPAP